MNETVDTGRTARTELEVSIAHKPVVARAVSEESTIDLVRRMRQQAITRRQTARTHVDRERADAKLEVLDEIADILTEGER
jgi:hypothetical protein